MIKLENDRKHFKKPVLIEAICEFYFDYLDERKWDKSYSGIILQALQSEYPKFEPVNETSVGLQINADGNVSHRLLPPKTKFKYSDNDNNSIFLTENTFAISQNAKSGYTWESFHEKLFVNWEKISKIVGVKSIKRIGLRYINHIPLQKGEPLQKWINVNSDYLSKFSFESEGYFTSTIQKILNSDNDSLSINLIYTKFHDKDNETLVFDIDRISNKIIESENKNKLFSVIETLHTKIEDVFFSSITDELDTHMEP
jgi:uncharacterized protein (TIGR04255 family)